ncbi:ABC transporter permease [Konateibacter massiliensis]|uniref:ABC transporter permease n=1 Tax=Konateibacter massiliensis TaxID=2002841 RepID=UPI000C1598F3|nr:ABC transporter permease [Konateibacter massiliensis]
MKQNRFKSNKLFDKAIAIAIVFSAWKILTCFFPPLVVPTIESVVKELTEICVTGTLYNTIKITMVRLVIGLTIGVILGLILGIMMGYVPRIKGILMPIIGILQTVPPVSWVVLALVWFGFNGKPVVFIVVISSLPIIAINVCQGIEQIDKRLMQMAKLYHFSKINKLRHVILPSIFPYFETSFRVALGSGWKIAVMGEVLTTSDGIGGMIKLARLNIEPENIIAWSIIIVLLFYISDIFIFAFMLGKDKKNAVS